MWTSEKIFLTAETYFDSVCRAIERAKSTVSLEMYIFRHDQLGQRLLTALVEAAARGVRVRLVVDGVGSPQFGQESLQRLMALGVLARVYHPAPGRLSGWRFPTPDRLISFFARINKRNHRKLVVIDDELAFTGSCNVTELHQNWRETAVRVSGSGVAELSGSFDYVWSRSSNPLSPRGKRIPTQTLLKKTADRLVRINCTRRLRQRHNSEIVHRISVARRRVWITTAYFIPTPGILAALVRASLAGCDVRLLLPGKNDITLVACVSRMFYRSLMLAGVAIFEYQPTMLHAKTLLIDDWCCIGTTNLNHRSLRHDLEVDIALSAEVSRDAMVRQFLFDLNLSHRMTGEQLNRRSLMERLSGYLMYPFRGFI